MAPCESKSDVTTPARTCIIGTGGKDRDTMLRFASGLKDLGNQ